MSTLPLPPEGLEAQPGRDRGRTTDPAARRGLWARAALAAGRRIESFFGGPARTRVIVVFGGVLALSSADTATVGASATPLRHALHVTNSDLGLLVGVNCIVAAVASLPFGVIADRFRRKTVLGVSIVLWGVCMVWSALVNSFDHLLVSRLALGVVTASAGPVIASMLGDWFPGAERGRIYSYVLTGELLGGGVGFAITGDVSALSWRLSFLLLAVPAFLLARMVFRLPEPLRGGRGVILPGATEIPTRPVVAADPLDEVDDAADNVAHHVSRSKGVEPDRDQVLDVEPGRMGFWQAVRYIMSIRTNVAMIVASALSYFYLTGVQTFGAELVHQQYGINQALANLLLLVVGLGAVVGVLVGGRLGDSLLRRRFLNGRVFVAAISAAIAAGAFIPALLTHHPMRALPYLMLAAFGLSAQNPPLNAARLDIMPAPLWGRAEGVRTFLRTAAQALAPMLFGFTSDYVFGGGQHALKWTFLVMLAPLAASTLYLFRALRSYPTDVATAAAFHDERR
ncbi:MAG TPA: MFS transporter [Mycobacteriales bacterium]|nr:MFS transporter [Mycobacteriales bacterium]